MKPDSREENALLVGTLVYSIIQFNSTNLQSMDVGYCASVYAIQRARKWTNIVPRCQQE